jgi:hypothetical protein
MCPGPLLDNRWVVSELSNVRARARAAEREERTEKSGPRGTDREERTERNGPRTTDRERRTENDGPRTTSEKREWRALFSRSSRSALLGPSFSVRSFRSALFLFCPYVHDAASRQDRVCSLYEQTLIIDFGCVPPTNPLRIDREWRLPNELAHGLVAAGRWCRDAARRQWPLRRRRGDGHAVVRRGN